MAAAPLPAQAPPQPAPSMQAALADPLTPSVPAADAASGRGTSASHSAANPAGPTVPTLSPGPAPPGGLANPATLAPPAQAGSPPAPAPAPAPSAQVAQALADFTRAPGGAQQMTLQLTPRELGTVAIQLTQGAGGTVTMTVQVARPETLALLVQDQAGLQRALSTAGIAQSGRSLTFQLSDAAGALPNGGGGQATDGQAVGGQPASAQGAPTTGSAAAASAFAGGNLGQGGAGQPGPGDKSLAGSVGTPPSGFSLAQSGGGQGGFTGSGGEAGFRRSGGTGVAPVGTPGAVAPTPMSLAPARWQRAGIDITA